MRFILIILSLIILSSCNPFISKDLRKKNRCNNRYKRTIKKCPELIKPITIKDTVYFEEPAIDIDSSVSIQVDTLGLDSIFNSFKVQFLDSVGQLKLRNEIVRHVQRNPCTSDTIRVSADGIIFTSWFGSGRMNYSIKRPKKKHKEIVEFTTNSFTPIELTLTEKVLNWIGRFWFPFALIIIMLLVLIFIYRFFVRK